MAGDAGVVNSVFAPELESKFEVEVVVSSVLLDVTAGPEVPKRGVQRSDELSPDAMSRATVPGVWGTMSIGVPNPKLDVSISSRSPSGKWNSRAKSAKFPKSPEGVPGFSSALRTFFNGEETVPFSGMEEGKDMLRLGKLEFVAA